MEYLICLKTGLGLAVAIITAIVIWRKKRSYSIDKPIELEDGNFAIPKPEDEFMGGIEFDEIRTEIKSIQNEQIQQDQRLPDPKGTPTAGPR